jgi:CBS-domain-containing membrane protein
MTPNPFACRPETDLAAAAMLLWEGDCGALPVVGPDREVIGMVTDRDLCMAVATTDRRACERFVGEIMTTPVVRCRPSTDVRDALAAMAKHRVRRLPVTDDEGRLAGVVSMADVFRKAGPVLGDESLAAALRAILRPHAETRSEG